MDLWSLLVDARALFIKLDGDLDRMVCLVDQVVAGAAPDEAWLRRELDGLRSDGLGS